MGRKVERLEVGLSQGIFEDEVAFAEKFISAEARKKAPTAYDSSFPVRNMDELMRAIQSFGRAPESKRSQLKAFLSRRANELGASDEVKDRIRRLGTGKPPAK